MAAAEPSGAMPLGAARLQPITRLQPGRLSQEEQADLDQLEINDPEEADEASSAAREVQRWNDLATVNDLALRNFEGPAYRTFEAALAGYGFPVVRSWLRRGLMFHFCAHRGRPAQPKPVERQHLANPTCDEAADDRRELALETNARALVSFRENVLLKNAWSFEGGASLRTYYVGACLLAFPNVFSMWATERRHRNFDAVEADPLTGFRDATTGWDALGSSLDQDPAPAVVSDATVAAELAAMPERTREAAARVILCDASYAEIAAELGVSERAVEGMLYRFRQTASGRQLSRRIL